MTGTMKLLTVADCAKELGVSERRVLTMIKTDLLKATKLGRDWVVDPKDLEACKKDRKERGVSE